MSATYQQTLLYVTKKSSSKYVSKLHRFIKYSMNGFICYENTSNTIKYVKDDKSLYINVLYIMPGITTEYDAPHNHEHGTYNIFIYNKQELIIQLSDKTLRSVYKSFSKYVDNSPAHIFSGLFDW